MPKEFAWPSFVGPSSRVIEAPADWCDEGLLIPHEAIRWWNKQILAILDSFDPIAEPETAWKTAVFFNWYENYYYVCIHHHHAAEEAIYTPGIEAKYKKPIGGNIKDDHEELLMNLDKSKAYRSKIAAGDSGALSEFKAFMKKDVIEFMEAHLAEEEVNYPVALRSSMTEEEEGALVGEIIQGLGLDGNKRFLTAIVYAMCMWKGEKAAMNWLSTATPPPIQLAFHKCWINDFYENQLRVLEALQQPTEFVPKTPECALCTVM